MVAADDVRQSLGSGKKLLLARALQVEVELRVRVARLESFGELEGERGLANAALTAQAGDGCAAPFDLPRQFGEFVSTAGEVGRRGRELVQRGDCRPRGFVKVLAALKETADYVDSVADVAVARDGDVVAARLRTFDGSCASWSRR